MCRINSTAPTSIWKQWENPSLASYKAHEHSPILCEYGPPHKSSLNESDQHSSSSSSRDVCWPLTADHTPSVARHFQGNNFLFSLLRFFSSAEQLRTSLTTSFFFFLLFSLPYRFSLFFSFIFPSFSPSSSSFTFFPYEHYSFYFA